MAGTDDTAANQAAYSPPAAIDAAALGHHGYHPAAPPPSPDAELHAEGQQLGGAAGQPSIANLTERVASLETQAADRQRHWYRDAASIVAILALAFSFGTTVVSLQRTAQQDTHDRKAELLTLIDRLSDITRQFADAQTTFANDPSTLSTLLSVLTQQQLLAAEQAAAIMQDIPGDVNAAELTFVANILVANNLDTPGLDLLQRAIDTSENANDRVGALRSKAVRLFQIGQVDEGRALYRQALDVFTLYPTGSTTYIQGTHLQTQVVWTQAELFAGACGEAKVHLDAARTYAVSFPATNNLVQQISTLARQIENCKPGASSSPSLPGLPSPAPS